MHNQEYNGVLEDPRSPELKARDHILGATSSIELKHKISYDKKYLPDGEPQSIPGVFDDMSCTTHSSINILNHLFTYFYQENLMKPENKQFLEDEGYIHDEKVRFSTVFSSTLNGTTKKGNYFHAVWDFHRNIGLIPYKDLPFTGRNWEENHNIKNITEAHREKAKKFFDRFDIQYAWLPTDSSVGVSQIEKNGITYYQDYAMIQIGTPIPANHAEAMYNVNDDTMMVLGTYVPYYRKKNTKTSPVNFYLFGYFTEKEPIISNTPILSRVLKMGMSGSDVKLLQANLRKLGYFTFPTDTGFFGTITLKAVKDFQLKNGIPQTGNYGDLTHAKIYKLLNK